jgi:RNA polymerase sigma-70 factor (ECF subfamily)
MNAMEGDELDCSTAYATADAVARRSYGKLVAFLATRTRDVAAAEDALSEAFTAALADWPKNGCAANPEGWLLAVAQRKLIDAARGQQRHELAAGHLQIMAEGLHATDLETDIPDRRLALIFACAHPAIDVGVRAPLILQVVLGFDAARIASAFLVSPATMGQRLVRAKNKIREAGIPFRIPDRDQLRERLSAVLDAIYATFAEGWSAASGANLIRRGLAEEAIFLGRLVARLLPSEPEALGLVALMLHSEARRGARRTSAGEYVPFAGQDPAFWNSRMIDEAEELLRRASALGAIGRYQLESAVQSAHVHRRRTGQANWAAVVQLYDALLALSGSPVVGINRALALAELDGPDVALKALQVAAADSRLREYQPYWAARAELLARTGSHDEARQAYDMAIGLETDDAVRRFLLRRQSAMRS